MLFDFQHPVLKIQLKDIRNIIKRRFLLRQIVNISQFVYFLSLFREKNKSSRSDLVTLLDRCYTICIYKRMWTLYSITCYAIMFFLINVYMYIHKFVIIIYFTYYLSALGKKLKNLLKYINLNNLLKKKGDEETDFRQYTNQARKMFCILQSKLMP